MNENKIILPITPQTKVDTTQNTWKVFAIPEVCYKGRWKKGCAEYKRTGLCKHTLNKQGRYMKKRLERYNDYKANVLALAKKYGFELPKFGWSIYFFIPIPKRWKLSERIAMHGQMHHRKPDIDNYLKGVFDSLTLSDEQIAQLSGLGKFWVDTSINKTKKSDIGPGWIEILVNQPLYNPFNVKFIDQSNIISLNQARDYKKRIEDGAVRKYKKKEKYITEQTLFSKEDKIK